MPQFTAMSLLLLKLIFLGIYFAPTIAGDEQQFSYSGFANANLTLDGTASVTPAGLLELTTGSAMSKGHAFHPSPLRFRKSPNGTVQSFSASFVFGIVSVFGDLSSHGIAFLIAPTKNFSAADPIGYLGLLNPRTDGDESDHIFAVELDTYETVEFHDMNGNHVGIDINSLVSVQAHDAGFYDDDEGGAFRNLTLSSQEAMQVWVDYDAEKTLVAATVAPLNVTKPTRPTVSTTYNLSTVFADDGAAYVGFSSSTGKIDSRHYVLGWSFAMSSSAPAINATMLPKMPRRLQSSKAPSKVVLAIVLPVVAVALLLSAMILLVRRHLRYAEVREDWEVEYGPHRISYKHLFWATEGFRAENILGTGGFGRVYRGVLPGSKSKVAVKRVSHDSNQGMKEFISEVVSVGRLRHRNLVQLLGYCRRKGELLLVYEYMPNRSLDKYLYGTETGEVLSWPERLRIIKGIASCLLYLHEEWEKVVVHRDIKASNVLLDDEMNGRLGDFGLARLYDHGVDPHTTNVVGTIGYMAPELARSGKATPLTDVFAFGIFVLEVTCGRRPIMAQESQDVLLADWVLQLSQNGSLMDAVDTVLQGDYDAEEACLALKLGLLCAHPFASARPTMRQVMQYLHGDTPPSELMMPTHQSFQVLTSMQEQGLNPYIMAYPSSSTSIGTISFISGGR